MNNVRPLAEAPLFKRQFPRRAMKRLIGVLCDGVYFVAESGEVGEGGMSLTSDYILSENHQVLLSFQIPGGSFVYLRATVRSTEKKMGDSKVTHGLSFVDVPFALKRQIRSFVSGRGLSPAKNSAS